jgi:hypothetical protein
MNWYEFVKKDEVKERELFKSMDEEEDWRAGFV